MLLKWRNQTNYNPNVWTKMVISPKKNKYGNINLNSYLAALMCQWLYKTNIFQWLYFVPVPLFYMPYQLRKDNWPRAIFEIPRAKDVVTCMSYIMVNKIAIFDMNLNHIMINTWVIHKYKLPLKVRRPQNFLASYLGWNVVSDELFYT